MAYIDIHNYSFYFMKFIDFIQNMSIKFFKKYINLFFFNYNISHLFCYFNNL